MKIPVIYFPRLTFKIKKQLSVFIDFNAPNIIFVFTFELKLQMEVVYSLLNSVLC